MDRLSCPFEFKFSENGGASAGAFEGYASVFNNEDSYGDVMLPGAFKSTLASYKAARRMPKMLLNHGGLGNPFAGPAPDDLLPIGKWDEMSEDAKGLHVKGRLISLDTEHGKRIYGAMKEGALDSMSIAYVPRDFVRGNKENEPKRQLKAVDLLEAGPVTFPANEQATISGVKAQFDDVKSLRDFEAWLVSCGASRSAAPALASGGWAKFKPSNSTDEAGAAAFVQSLKQGAARMKGLR